MIGDGVDQRMRESPDAHKVGAKFGMGASEVFAFRGSQAAGGLSDRRQHLGVLTGHFGEQHQFADFVQDAGGGAFVDHGLGAFFTVRDALGQAGNSDAVFP